MFSNFHKLMVRLGLDISLFDKGADQAVNKMNKMKGKLAAGFGSLKTSVGNVANALTNLRTVIGTVITARTVQAIIQVTDQFNKLQARVMGLTEATGDFQGVFNALKTSARETGTSLGAVVQVFQRLSFARDVIGGTNEQMVELTDLVAKLGVISGTSSTNLRAGLIQFGQAMSSGIVRAEEFNSLMENIPLVVVKIAEAMGVTTGELRRMVVEGEVASKQVFDAILSKSGEIETAFQKVPMTVERAWNNLMFTITETFGLIDANTDSLDGLISHIQLLDRVIRDNQRTIAQTAKVVQFVLKTVVNGISVAATSVATGLSAVIGGIANMASSVVRTIESMINKVITRVNRLIDGINNIDLPFVGKKFSVSKLGKVSGSAVTGFFDNIASAFADATVKLARANKNFIGDIGRDWEKLFQPINTGGKAAINSIAGPGSLSEALDEAAGKAKKAKNAIDKLKSSMESLKESLRTITEKRNDSIGQALLFNKLFPEEFDQEQLKRAITKADKAYTQALRGTDGFKELKKELSEITKNAFIKPFDDLKDDLSLDLPPEVTERLSFYNEVLEKIKTKKERLAELEARLNDLYENQYLTQEELTKALKAYREELDETIPLFDEVKNFLEDFGQKFEDTFINSFKEGRFSVKEFFAALLEDLARLIFKLTVTIPLVKALTNWFQRLGSASARGGGGGGIFGSIFGFLGKGVGSLLGGLFGGGGVSVPATAPITFAADGATASAGQPFIVGENEPEFFVPKTAGTIVPQSALGGGGSSISQKFEITVMDARGVREVLIEQAPFLQRMTLDALQKHENKRGRFGPMDSNRRQRG